MARYLKRINNILFTDNSQPLIYFRYVDDTFAVLEDELNCNQFLKQLNLLHQSVTFTHEKKINGSLFRTSLWKKAIENFKLLFTGNRYLPASTIAGILDLKADKPVSSDSRTPSFGYSFAFKVTSGNRFHSIDSLLK